MPNPAFLSDIQLRPVKLPPGTPYAPIGLALGQGGNALEILVLSSDRPPNSPRIRTIWKDRHKNRPAPLLVAVLHGELATLCGIPGSDPPVYENVEIGLAERLCLEALEQPNRHAAERFLRDSLLSVRPDAVLPGIRNEGFLSTHELAHGARLLPSWNDAHSKASNLLGRADRGLLTGLGFETERCDQVTSILRTKTNGTRVALAVLLQPTESPDGNTPRFSDLSPVAYAMSVAERENLPYVLVVHGRKLRLYPVRTGFGVAQRGRTETFVEVHTGLLKDADAGFLWLLFSADALTENGSLEQLMEASHRFAGKLAERLRERIYGKVIPALAEGIAGARGLTNPTAQDLAQTYEMALTILFRLLFIAYAEDKDLLPYKSNGLYQRRSLKTKAQELLERAKADDIFTNNNTFAGDSTTHWEEVDRLFRAVNDGNRDWGVPAYDGGLFIRDAEVSEIGGLLAELSLPDSIMGPVLRDLLLIESREGWGPVDFRSLGVREFGTIYEGLLESELSVAEVGLTVDKGGFYRPCKAGEEPIVIEGRIYLHNRSGARKATGTYFTKSFAVEYLLDQALEPALIDHFKRIDAIQDVDEASGEFFDFRVADIAMGSGHFLVAAIDRIERAFSQYLSNRPLPAVRAELHTLQASALDALGPLAEIIGAEIEDTQLLRRLIARRCIYGVDINPISVQLARLSIWIHTFVPGLPLSMLNHNLVGGNSLVGIGRISEIEHKAREDDLPLFTLDVQRLVGEAMEPLRRLANIADATVSDIRRARRAMAEAKQKCKPA